jgi:dihydrofolate synthase/folylpolyglutamate synthase
MSISCVPPAEPVVVRSTSPRCDYAAAVDYLFGLINYERVSPARSLSYDFRLDRMRALLRAVGSPHERLPAVHIAGTKGKGSTAAMLAAMLQESGVRTGLFTSPHMQRFEERMTVNGEQPSECEIVSLTRTVRSAAEGLASDSGFRPATFFEVTTAIAWLFFQSRQAELVVLETGLGGRLDATNVCHPLLAIITSISRDHMHLLGESLAEIAAEKAGIIKAGVPVICGVMDPAAREVIARAAAEHDAPLVQFDEALQLGNTGRRSAAVAWGPAGWTGDVKTPTRVHVGLTSPLAGEHQLKNMALAVAALDQLRECGVPIPESAVETGLSRTWCPLRIEVVRRHPLVILDAAHNDASIEALLNTIQAIPARRRRLIFGTSRDKDAAAMLRLVAGKFDDVILTQYQSNPRALDIEVLGELARTNGIAVSTLQPDPASAWESAQALAAEDDLICTTGSFFLAAEFRELLVGSIVLERNSTVESPAEMSGRPPDVSTLFESAD